MNKADFSMRLAKESRVSKAQAADQVDRVVHEILRNLRRGQATRLPGLGSFSAGKNGNSSSIRTWASEAKLGESEVSSIEYVSQLVRLCLDEGKSVEIDGLGVFELDSAGRYTFRPRLQPKVFLAYVEEDLALVNRLYENLEERGYAPWLDRRKLLPGQNWPRAIEEAIETSDFVVACFSHLSVRKRGAFQSEIRYALDCAARAPLDEAFLIPARLDDCKVPWRIRREIHYIDLFPDWGKGVKRIVSVVEKQLRRRR